MDGQTVRKLSLVAQADDMIRHTRDLLTSLCAEDQLKELLQSQQTVIQKLVSDKQDLEASHMQLTARNKELEQSCRRMKCQLDSVRAALVNERAAKSGMRKELGYYNNMISQLRCMVHVEPALPAESPVRQIISRQMSRISQTNEMRNGLDTTDDSLSDLEYDKSEDELKSAICLTADTPPETTPYASPIRPPRDTSFYMNSSLMNETVVEAAAPAEKVEEVKEVEEGEEVLPTDMKEKDETMEQYVTPMQSATPSTSTLASVTSQKSKCSVPSDMLMKSIESRAHDFKAKKLVLLSTCAGCKRTLFYSSVKCCACSAVAHSNCQSRVPVPCLPAAAPTCRRQSYVRVCIADYCPVQRPCVPPILVLCFREIERRGSTIDMPYAREEELSLGAKVKALILSSKCAPDLTSYSVHVLCEAVKSFLRSLDEPLITRVLWHDFASASVQPVKQDRENALYTPISQLPECNRHSLAYLCKHLHTIHNLPQCRMTHETLANVFAALVVGHSHLQTKPDMRGEKTIQKNIMLALLMDIPSGFWNHVLALQAPACSSLSRLWRQPSSASQRSCRRSSVRGGAAVSNAMLSPVDEDIFS